MKPLIRLVRFSPVKVIVEDSPRETFRHAATKMRREKKLRAEE
jgi:hypothetical protein